MPRKVLGILEGSASVAHAPSALGRFRLVGLSGWKALGRSTMVRVVIACSHSALFYRAQVSPVRSARRVGAKLLGMRAHPFRPRLRAPLHRTHLILPPARLQRAALAHPTSTGDALLLTVLRSAISPDHLPGFDLEPCHMPSFRLTGR